MGFLPDDYKYIEHAYFNQGTIGGITNFEGVAPEKIILNGKEYQWNLPPGGILQRYHAAHGNVNDGVWRAIELDGLEVFVKHKHDSGVPHWEWGIAVPKDVVNISVIGKDMTNGELITMGIWQFT